MVLSNDCYNRIRASTASKVMFGDLHPSTRSSKDGTHHWLGDKNPIHKTFENGKSVLGENHPARILAREGKCSFGHGENHWVHDAIKNGTYKSGFGYGEDNNMVKASKDGTHYYIGTPAWESNNSNAVAKYTWSIADQIHKLYNENYVLGYITFTRFINKTLVLEKEISSRSVDKMIKYFKNNWSPLSDPKWINFKDTYIKELK